MSIIYKALQKTQENITNKHQQKNQTTVLNRSLWFDRGLILVICILLIIIVEYYPIVKKHISLPTHWFQTSTAKSSTPMVFPEVDYSGDKNLILSGVFVSKEERIAMINNQQMHIGEIVNGMKLISIEQDKIKLLSDNVIYVMHL